MSYNKALTAPVMTWENGEAFACFIENIGEGAVDGIGFDMSYEHQIAHCSEHPCETAMCIGGWCALAIPVEEREDTSIAKATMLVLGIEQEAAEQLCYPHLDGQTYQLIKASHAAQAIRNTIKDGAPSWAAILKDVQFT